MVKAFRVDPCFAHSIALELAQAMSAAQGSDLLA